MSCIHRLQHLKSLPAPALPDNDPVRSHSKGCLYQIPDGHLELPFKGRGSRFKRYEIFYAHYTKLRRILDGDDPFIPGNEVGKRIQHRGLAAPGPAAYEDVAFGADHTFQEFSRLL